MQAISFHSDDLNDCGWQTTIQIDVPEGTRSGVYGLEIDNGVSKDTIPFYVIPGKRAEQKKDRLPCPDVHLHGLCELRSRQFCWRAR